MADEEQVGILRQGAQAWNVWREHHGGLGLLPDLSEANLSETNLSEAALTGADLRKANLNRARLAETDLYQANLSEATLVEADLTGATLIGANLTRASLDRAIFHSAIFYDTLFVDVDLNSCKGLDRCVHWGPSIIDFQTLQRFHRLPVAFLRSVGLPDKLIDSLRSAFDQSDQFYSCFISYSSKDELFAKQLHESLQNKGVQCWFAPHDLPVGAKTWDAIDEAIRIRDKLLLILSEASISSDWVEDEVSKAYAEERDRNATMLVPIRIDQSVMTTPEPWARKLRDQRNIGDFRQWDNHDCYQTALDRLLRDLEPPPSKPYLHHAESELSTAMQDMARRSAWAKWLSAQHLAHNNHQPISEQALLYIVCGVVLDQLVEGTLRAKGRKPTAIEYEPISQAAWRLAALKAEPHPASLWRIKVIPRAKVDPDRISDLLTCDSIMVDSREFESIWPARHHYTDNARRKLLEQARVAGVDPTEIRKLSN